MFRFKVMSEFCSMINLCTILLTLNFVFVQHIITRIVCICFRATKEITYNISVLVVFPLVLLKENSLLERLRY